jgi:PP-loop superfamily ATP-utilizing enzyme
MRAGIPGREDVVSSDARRDTDGWLEWRESVVLSWSGGKDSALALAALRQDESVEVVGLLTSVTRGYVVRSGRARPRG